MAVQTTKTATVRLPNERQATVEKQRSRADYQARISISLDEEWVFGVREDWIAELLTSYDADGNLADTELPDWIEYVMDLIGLAGVEA